MATDAEYVTGTDATRVLTPSVARSNNIVSGVTVTASGTSVDFTGIPSWVKRLTIMLSGMSTNGTSPVIIRIGDSGGVENTGYNGVTLNSMGAAVNTANHSSGILQDNAGASTYIRNGCIQFTKIAGNTWIYVGLIGNSEAARSNQYSGSKSLSDVLTQIRVTTVGGTDDFDAGSINILYE